MGENSQICMLQLQKEHFFFFFIRKLKSEFSFGQIGPKMPIRHLKMKVKELYLQVWV